MRRLGHQQLGRHEWRSTTRACGWEGPGCGLRSLEGETKVDNLYNSGTVKHDVAMLDVAVLHEGGVGAMQSVSRHKGPLP